MMMLKPRDASGPWQRMLVVLGEGELRLENELGETLASASDLPALLDAVEGGVATGSTSDALPPRAEVMQPLAGFIL